MLGVEQGAPSAPILPMDWSQTNGLRAELRRQVHSHSMTLEDHTGCQPHNPSQVIIHLHYFPYLNMSQISTINIFTESTSYEYSLKALKGYDYKHINNIYMVTYVLV